MSKISTKQHIEKLADLYAHRGVSSLAVENTMDAFKLAVDMDIPGIELDIQWLTSGETVVYHDEKLDRFFDSRQILQELSKDEFDTLNKSSQHPGIPFFRDVLHLAKGHCCIDIEIKPYRMPEIHQLQKALEEIHESGMETQVVISSFDPRILIAWKSLGSSIPVGLIYDDETKKMVEKVSPWQMVLAEMDFEKPDHHLTEDIKRALKNNKVVIPWTVDDVETGQKLKKMGVSAIITNTPQDYVQTRLTKIIQ